MGLEEVWRRQEESMRRKQQMKAQANGNRTDPDAPPSPASTGAMDVLLEKLRAAAPAAKDQRDRRRRARLKDKHQVRVASGQKIPETGENLDETGLLSPTITDASEPVSEGATSEGEDIADRAASMLQGLRGDGDDGPAKDDSVRAQRRRESADSERARRRARRRAGGTSIDQTKRDTITEETTAKEEEDAEVVDKRSSGESNESEPTQLPTPTTIVVPPSPTASERRAAEEDED